MKIIKFFSRTILFTTAIGISIFILFFIIACTWIGFDVKTQCLNARRDYGGTCVKSLVLLLEDENRNFRDRNSAIWALGQLGDSGALPTLQRFYTGNIPDRESLDTTISQYELKKAINLARGGTNITAIFWRHNLD